MRLGDRLAGLVVAFGLLVAFPAKASEPDETLADARFREGEKLFEAQKYDEAAAAWVESQRLDPQLGTLINLALCHEAMQKTATAMREFDAAATWAAQRHQGDREAYARKHAADLAKRAAIVHLDVPASSTGYTIAVDGEPLAPSQWAMPLFLDPGPHAVRVTSLAMQDEEVAVTVPPGASDQTVKIEPLVLAPVPPPRPAAPPPVIRDSQSGLRRPVGIMAAGVGLVALSLAGYLVAHDGSVSAEAVATGVSGGIVLGGGAWLYVSGSPGKDGAHATCATIGVASVF